MNELFKVYFNDNVIDEETKEFIKQWHYSKSARSLQQTQVFKMFRDNELVGVAIYGNPMSRHYNESNYIELRRLCLIDETPRNSESFFIAKTLKWLKNYTTYKGVISFADPNQGHQGTIYKASNFKFDGEEKNGNPRIVRYRDKDIHLRQYYQKVNGEYTENALQLQSLVEKGEAQILKQERKLRYIYEW